MMRNFDTYALVVMFLLGLIILSCGIRMVW